HGEQGFAFAGRKNQQLAVGRDKVYAAVAGGAGRIGPRGDAGNAGHANVGATDGADARHADAGADGSAAKGEGRRVRPAVFDGHDSAPQWRADYGEGFVRHGGGGAGRRHLQLRDGCGQHATGGDQGYAIHFGKDSVKGETMNRVQRVASRLAGVAAAAIVMCSSVSTMQAQTPAPAPPAKEAAKPPDADQNPFAPQPAPPLPAGMTGSDANDPRFKLTPGMYDAGETSMGMKHLLLLKKPDA